MKTLLWAFVGLTIIIGAYVLLHPNEIPMTTGTTSSQHTTIQVVPIEHATAVIRWGEKTLYIDPTGEAAAFAGQPVADIVLVTDIHGDHLSESTLAAVTHDATLIVPQAVKDILPEALAAKARVVRNGESTTVDGFRIEAMPMYNIPESAEAFHVKGRGNGYRIEREGMRVYIAGDTSGTPEMRAMQDIDIAFVPMNLPYTMSVEEAADAVLEFKPRTVYPYHYRGQGGLSDVARFKQLVNAGDPNIEVVLAAWYPRQ